MSICSQTLSHDEDSGSINSRSSMEFVSSPMDDRERIGHIDSAIRWIKEELAEMRDKDKTILQYLSQAQTCIRSIQKQQQHSLKVHSNVTKRQIFGSTEDLNRTQQTVTDNPLNDRYGTLAAKHPAKPFISSGALCTSPSMLTPVTLTDTSGEDMLNSFLNEGSGKKPAKKPMFSFDFDDPPELIEEEKEVERNNKTSSHADGNRGSAVFEIQQLRKQLQQETRKELADFDKEFDTPKSLLEIKEDKKSYRYSILNRMDELLNHTLERNEDGHTRQHSEPVMLSSSVSEWAISGNKQKKAQLKQESQSFRYPSKPPEMVRSDSAGFSKAGGKKNGVGGTHYDTTVVGKRRTRSSSRSSSRSSTLEKQHPLHYSLDAQNPSDTSDRDSPTHSVTRVSPTRQGEMTPSTSFESDLVSPEVYPEQLSPLSPLLKHMDPFMMTSQVFEEYISSGGSARARDYNSRSDPLSRKNGVTSRL